MKRFVSMMTLGLLWLIGSHAKAETLIYAHGWLPGGNDLSWANNTSSSSGYPWGSMPSGAVNIAWNTGANWTQAIANAKTTLDARCSRAAGQSCTVVCHSTGCPITAAALDIHGTSGGVPRWRINRVLTLGSAEGGTELASTGAMANVVASIWGGSVVTPSVSYLSPSYVRGAYDHNDTAGSAFFHVAGYDGGSYGSAGLLPGQDDGVVPFHSACGYVKVFSATQCSNDWEWVRKTSWGVPYYVMREVARWTNHTRVEYCGRDGCDKTHMQLVANEFQNLATVPNP
ncbi:MAG TPA: hypothetical protein VHP33_17085 [Polyangiaceae bacterium]|nr:hypothetical protein [Polyangiaceae bacterium]